MKGTLSECAAVTPLPTVDIGGSNTASQDATYWAAWQDMRDYEHVYVKVRLGTWDATDDLDTCKLQQADSSTGGNAKDLTTASATGDYDTDDPIDAAGNTVVLEARKADLDVTNGFRYVRAYCAETGNTGVDNIEGVLIRHCANEKYSQREGAAATGVTVYVKPS